MINLGSLSSLFTPFLVAAGMLLAITIADTQEIYIREISVPPTFTRAGYSPVVVDTRIRDNLLQLERIARTRPETRQLAIEADKSPMVLIAEYFNIGLVARALQDASGMIDYSIDGSVVVEGDNHVLRLAIRHRSGAHIHVTATRPIADIEGLLHDAATGVLQVVDPHILCTIRLRTGLHQAPPNLVPARQCIERSLPIAEREDRIWLHNLAGVVAFMQQDYAGATSAFRAALQLDHEFSPSLLNLGILFAHAGRHDEAIRAYEAVFHRDTRGESRQTFAAAYTEWANSLLALGRREEALRRYADAVRVDPRYALAYFFWADALPPGPQADRMRERGERARQINDQVYTENLVGVIRDTPPRRPN